MLPYGRRLKYAFRSFFSILDYSRIPEDVVDAMVKKEPPPAPVPAVEPMHRATQLLMLLQRDGRLVDFLMEDLGSYADAQIGAAVRDVHAGCRQSLDRYVSLGPVMSEAEGQTVTLGADADPARVKIVGNATGKPPLRGILRHRGWTATRVELPPLTGADPAIVAPAEIEIP